MSLALTIDLVEDSGLSQSYSGNRIIQRATRVATVANLDDGSTNAAATALARALLFVARSYPLYSGYPGASCVVTAHEAVGIFDDLAKIRIVYDTPTIAAPGANLIVGDTTSTVKDTTQIIRNDITGSIQQVIVFFQDPTNQANNKPTISNVEYDRTLRHIVFTGNIRAIDLDPFRKCVNYVNSDTWYGLPPGFWKFEVLHDETRDLGRTYDVQLEVRADLNRDWSRYVVGKDRNNGQYLTVRQADLFALQKAAYTPFGIIRSKNPGCPCIRVCPYGAVPFTSIFGPQRTS